MRDKDTARPPPDTTAPTLWTSTSGADQGDALRFAACVFIRARDGLHDVACESTVLANTVEPLSERVQKEGID